MRSVLIHYSVVIDLDDDQPQGEGIPSGVPIEFDKLGDNDLREAIGENGVQYFRDVKSVEPDSVEFLD